MCCDHCKEWRLVDVARLPALREEENQGRLSSDEYDWGAWLDGA